MHPVGFMRLNIVVPIIVFLGIFCLKPKRTNASRNVGETGKGSDCTTQNEPYSDPLSGKCSSLFLPGS